MWCYLAPAWNCSCSPFADLSATHGLLTTPHRRPCRGTLACIGELYFECCVSSSLSSLVGFAIVKHSHCFVLCVFCYASCISDGDIKHVLILSLLTKFYFSHPALPSFAMNAGRHTWEKRPSSARNAALRDWEYKMVCTLVSEFKIRKAFT